MAKNGSDATVYAVGDVHGRYDLLLEVLAWIRADRDETGNPARLVMLGDYVDRGPESRKVIETLINEVSDLNPVCLIGNHERSEEHTSELQSLMRTSYAVFCLKKKTTNTSSTKDPTK